jgi:GT2 family glycosyltransferase
MDYPISVVIPNFNGKALMERHLPSVVLALGAYPGESELILVDDASRDDSVPWLMEAMPEALLIEHAENRGFAAACSTGIQSARHEIVLLFNTDVSVRPNAIQPLVNALAGEEVFAAGCLALEEDQTTVAENLKIPRLSMGKLKFDKLKNMDLKTCRSLVSKPLPTLFTTGGFMAFKKSIFYRLGGFDPLFEPFYSEDTDLCYRAWKRGYRVLWVPSSLVVHYHEGTILQSHKDRQVRMIQERNRLLFLWKNLTSPGLLIQRHLLPLLFRTLVKWMVLDFTFYRALGGALLRIRSVLKGRAREKAEAIKGDNEIFLEIRSSAPEIIKG